MVTQNVLFLAYDVYYGKSSFLYKKMKACQLFKVFYSKTKWILNTYKLKQTQPDHRLLLTIEETHWK